MRKLIAGPSVFICDECIELCNDIIRDETQAEGAAGAHKGGLPTPAEICGILVDETLWPHQPLGRNIGGTPESVKALPRAAVVGTRRVAVEEIVMSQPPNERTRKPASKTPSRGSKSPRKPSRQPERRTKRPPR